MSHDDKKEKKLSYIDGIRVKISEKYKPPMRVTLPFSCHHVLTQQVLAEDYDFKLEESVIAKMPEWRRARDSAIEKRNERLKTIENVRQQEIENYKNLNISQNEKESEPKILNPILTDSVLTPMYAISNTQAVAKQTALFNISDFESDNSSPFDNMELKTINDMEVLAKVLSNTNSNLPKHSFYNGGLKDWSNKNGWKQYEPDSNRNEYVISSSPRFEYLSKSLGNTRSSGTNDTYNNYQTLPQFTATTATASSNRSADMSWKTAVNILDGISADPDKNIPEEKSNSKSVPDIVQELEKELRKKRDFEVLKLQPIRPVSLESTGLENWKPYPELESPHRIVSKQSRLPDPTSDLNDSARTLATHISEMGFPLPRVARICQMFENDDKKVIEFLLQIQNLEEKKYPGDEIEIGLVKNNFNEEETIKYLNAMITLLDLGFDPEVVSDALTRSNNDRDKALDLLIS